jgi:hypothetical protein
MELKILFYVLFHRYTTNKNGNVVSGGFLTVVLSNWKRVTYRLGNVNLQTPGWEMQAKLWLLYFSDVLKETGNLPPQYMYENTTLDWYELPDKYRESDFNLSEQIRKLKIAGIEETIYVEKQYDISKENLSYENFPFHAGFKQE